MGLLCVLLFLLSATSIECGRIIYPNCKCGSAGASALLRVTGGEETRSHPWAVPLIDQHNRAFCGGVIINSRWILTANHCVWGKKAQNVRVALGTYDLRKPQQLAIVSEIVGHRNFRDPEIPKQQFDIALLRLSTEAIFDTNVKPICLPTPDMLTFENLMVVGWGDTDYGAPPSDVLRKAQVHEVPHFKCELSWGSGIKSTQVCATAFNGPCSGDSGGPLMTSRGGTQYVVGLVSYSGVCGDYRRPTVYTRVTSYLEHIESHATDGGWCLN